MAFLKSSCLTPTMIFSSLDPWSIILTLIWAWARAEKILPAVPRVERIPLPTIAIRARSDSSSMWSGFTALWIPASTCCSFSSNSSLCTKICHCIDAGRHMLDGNTVFIKLFQYLAAESDLGVHHCFFNGHGSKSICPGNSGNGVILAVCRYSLRSVCPCPVEHWCCGY